MLKINRYIQILGIFPKFSNRKKYDLKQACCLAGFNLQLSFFRCSNYTLLKIWNGVGASGKWYNRFIPKHIWLLNIELASCPHDYDYWRGGSELDKQRADKRFYSNLKRWIDTNTNNPLLKKLRYIGAYKYYVAVKDFGGSAFNYH